MILGPLGVPDLEAPHALSVPVWDPALGRIIWRQTASPTSLGLGTMALQNATGVAITGGAVDGATLGATTRAAARVTTLDANALVTASAGINFGGTSLTTYSEGTFTPTLAGTSTAGTQTYSLQTGRYTRIGNRVMFNIELALSALDGTSAGSARIRGLPFTSVTSSGARFAVAIGVIARITLSAGKLVWYASIDSAVTEVRLWESVSAGSIADLPITNFAATSEIHLGGSYEV